MTQEERLIALASAIGADIKQLRTSRGDLTTLRTTAKSNLVASINEIYGLLGSSGAVIDDEAGNGGTSVTWSADKIFDTIEAAKQQVKDDIIGGASEAYDTLLELQELLEADQTLTASLADAMTKRVRFDAAQTLSQAQKRQACENIGIGDPDTDLVATYNTAKA